MRTLLLLLSGLVFHASAMAACPPAGSSRAQLVELKAAEGVPTDSSERQALALALLACLSDPDPVLRDDIAFSVLASWMRAQKLNLETLSKVRTTQLASLKQEDAFGFAQPFAALILAEVARSDRIKAHLSGAERTELVQAGAAYLASVRDYRGYDEKQGWRHGVAHAADLMMQLSLNPALGKTEQQLILQAVAAQLSAAGAHSPSHFFQYGEGERLAAPVFHLSRRADLDAGEWDLWFRALSPAPSGNDGPRSKQLAHRHNVRSFLMTMYVMLNESKDVAQRERVLPHVRRALGFR